MKNHPFEYFKTRLVDVKTKSITMLDQNAFSSLCIMIEIKRSFQHSSLKMYLDKDKRKSLFR